MGDLTLLTREGCGATPAMATHLADALAILGWSPGFACEDIAELPEDDPRRGYPTPTVLWNGRDLFGLPIPVPPYPAPT
ncbi:MAG: hypothetical protein AB7O67_21075 [Vicinamibacterales bacterium]